MSKAGGPSLNFLFGTLIVLGKLHIIPISKWTYSNCAVLPVLTKCKKFSEMYVRNAGIAHNEYASFI